MKYIKVIAAAALTIAALTACESDWNPSELLSDEGKVNLSSIRLNVDSEVEAISRGALEDITPEQLTVRILDHSGNQLGQWLYGDMPSEMTLPVGSYSIDVENAPLQEAAWESPWLHAAREFTITKNEVTELGEITCSLSNVMVSVAYSEALAAALDPSSRVEVEVVEGGATLVYALDEQRAGYFALPNGESSVTALFTGVVNGREVTLRKSFGGLKAGQHRIITFSLNNGSLDPSIVVDADIDYSDIEIDIPGDEDPGEDPHPGEDPDPNIPTITSETLDLNGVNIVTEDLISQVWLRAPNGFAHINVTIVSQSLNGEALAEVGLTDKFDLAEPGEYREALESLGFPVAENVVGKTEVLFDITDFAVLLQFFPGEDHKFEIEVVDQLGNTANATLIYRAL